MSSSNLDQWAIEAKAGSADAVEKLIKHLQHEVFRIALRVFWHPQEAEDATQEAMVRIITRLNQFEGRSAFKTWATRVAVNHFLSVVRSQPKEPAIDFEEFGRGLAVPGLNADLEGPMLAILVEEAKVGCSQAMLQCLDRRSRIAYVLSEILGVSSDEGAEIMELTGDNFRQIASRAARAISQFMNGHCGVVNPDRPCRCKNQIAKNIDANRINPDRLLFADTARSQEYIKNIDEVLGAVELFQKSDRVHQRKDFSKYVREIFEGRRI